MDSKKILRSILFLSIGIALFWWVFRDTDLENLEQEFRKVNWLWIFLSLALNLLSLTTRGMNCSREQKKLFCFADEGR